jgi:hypothetical protein
LRDRTAYHGYKTRLFIFSIASIINPMKSETVKLDDLEMYCEMEGAGEPLLLLHGGTPGR